MFLPEKFTPLRCSVLFAMTLLADSITITTDFTSKFHSVEMSSQHLVEAAAPLSSNAMFHFLDPQSWKNWEEPEPDG